MTGLDELPLRDDLRGQQPYGAPQLDVAVRLNTNENPHPPSQALADDIGAAATATALTLNRYPDREAAGLRADLAAYLSRDGTVRLDAEQVWAANGSNEVLQQLLQAFGGPGRRAMGFEPSYSMHRLIALATSTGWVAGHRDAGFGLSAASAVEQVRAERPDVVFLCSPNNPTATALDHEVVEQVVEAAPGMVVVDEAYAEFSHRLSLLRLLADRPRLVVTRTMSKAFAFAGARVGYLAAAPALTDALRLVRLPYHLSAITQAAALAALRHAGELLGRVDELRARRDETAAWLAGQGYAVAESDANFVLFGRFADRHATWQALLDKGVLIRETGPDGWLRVSIGSAQEMAAFAQALDNVSDAQENGRVAT